MSNTMIIEMSVTKADLDTFLRAWVSTKYYGMPSQITTSPTIAFDGINYKITTPRINPDRAAVLLTQFDNCRVDACAPVYGIGATA